MNPSSSSSVEDSEYWRVNLPFGPTHLEKVMWGTSGVPPPPAPPAVVSTKRKNDTIINGNFATSDVESCAQHEIRDNILSALEISGSNEQMIPTHIPEPEKILLEDIVWKQRSGFGRYSLGFLHHEWEQRRLVLYESGILKYYTLEKEAVVYDPQHATDPKKSPWVYNVNQEPRGQIDLKARKGKAIDSDNAVTGDNISHASSFEEGMRRLTSFVPSKEKGLNTGGVTVQARERQGNPGPTPFEIEITRSDNNLTWRFCFECQAVQIEWLSMINSIASDGMEETIGEETEVTEGLGDHGFHAGDHIIRWEILPVLYPIQIHGIVLEAGKNCVIIADFGLASYNNHDHNGLTTHLGDETKDDEHDAIMEAWEKIKPKQKKRLNVIVVTETKVIKKWSKINYGSQVLSEKDKKNKLFSLLPRRSKQNTKKADNVIIATSSEENTPSHESSAPTIVEGVEAEGFGASTQDIDKDNGAQPGDNQAEYWEGEPDWIRPGFGPRKRTGSSAPVPLNKEGQSVFSIDRPEQNPARELPKSDSSKLVLSRTHFILEHEDLLPPYHVFYSNSECIAVWCKTGRWSTLQAAVYLVSSSVGFGKSATMITLTVAAAHAVLVPALAVGGLAVVGAPLLFLKSAKEQWNLTTMDLTEKFWMQADSDVFVEAIEYWSGLAISANPSSKITAVQREKTSTEF